MVRTTDITLHELHEDTGAALRRAEGGEHLRVIVDRQSVAQLGPLEDSVSWVDGELMEARIRSAQADSGLREQLDELQPDTITDLCNARFWIRRSSSLVRAIDRLPRFRPVGRWGFRS